MNYRIIFPTAAIGAAVALAGAGCANLSSSSQAPVTNPSLSDSGTSAPLESTNPGIAVGEPAPNSTCTTPATITYHNTNDANTQWEIDMNGQKVATVTHDGEAAVYPWLEVPGMTYLAFDPTGLGGYIPYGSHETLLAVNHCTGEMKRFSTGNMTLYALSSDGAKLASIETFDGTSGSTMKLRVWDTAKVLGASDPDLSDGRPWYDGEWTIPGDWSFAGDVVFNADHSKLAFAAGTGPDNEHGNAYVLDLKTGTFTSVGEKADGLLYVDGWNSDGTPIVSIDPAVSESTK